MKTKFIASTIINGILVSILANGYILFRQMPQILYISIPLFLILNLFAGRVLTKTKNKRLRTCHHGTLLLCAFCLSMLLSIAPQVFVAIRVLPYDYITCIWSLAVCYAVHFVVFWNGILCVYLTSTQLGLKWRIIGILCGLIPVVNLIVLFFILRTTFKEYLFETRKAEINKLREQDKVCATKYPILLVHGVFFRDSAFLNYWGRIPQELEDNGASVFYGNHSSAASIADSAAELKLRIAGILAKTGAQKVNIIAHSKGGLDCRYAIAKLGVESSVASLTTINTPHRGCLFADYLLTRIPAKVQNKIANTYNTTLKKLGDDQPDFLAAVNDLTDAHCHKLNMELPFPKDVYCQSVGSVLTKATHGKFPLNFSYHLVKHFDGDNDGLVSEASFVWGEKYTLLKPSAKQGISHCDITDISRKNIPGFDVREFYVELVADLKSRGL